VIASQSVFGLYLLLDIVSWVEAPKGMAEKDRPSRLGRYNGRYTASIHNFEW
jgi:hypothetical protein